MPQQGRDNDEEFVAAIPAVVAAAPLVAKALPVVAQALPAILQGVAAAAAKRPAPPRAMPSRRAMPVAQEVPATASGAAAVAVPVAARSPATPAVPATASSPAPTPAPAAPAASPSPHVNPAAAQLQLLLRHPLVPHAAALAASPAAPRALPVGDMQIPVAAILNLLATFAAQAAGGAPAPESAGDEYLREDDGAYACDPADPTARAAVLMRRLSAAPVSPEDWLLASGLAAVVRR